MRDSGETMKLGAFLHPSGHHIAAWRHPRARANGHISFEHYVELARLAERGKFDTIFLADSPGVRHWPIETTSRVDLYVAPFEPLTILSALAPLTTHRSVGHRHDNLQRAISRCSEVCITRSHQ